MLLKVGEYYRLTDPERDTLNPEGIIIKDNNQIEVSAHNMFVPIWNHFGKNVDYIFDVFIDE